MTSDETIRKAARVMALTDDYDGCFERIDAWEAATDEQRACGDVEEPMSHDAEDCEFWLRRARALAEVGLIAPAPQVITTAAELDALPASTVVVDVAGVPRTKRYPDTHMEGGWTHGGREPLSSQALADGRPLTVVYRCDDRVEGDGKGRQ